VNALVPRGDEGRTKCDKLREVERGFDPQISEWDNPAALIGGYRSDEFIVRRGDTGWSETSQ